MNNFTQRVITGTVFVTVLLGSVLLSPYTFIALFCLITVLGVHEFYSLVDKDLAHPQKVTGIILSAILFLIFSFEASGILPEISFVPFLALIFFVFIFELYSKKEKPFSNIAFTLLGIIYVALPFSLLSGMLFLNGHYSPHVLVGYFLILWASDSGAYMIGSKFGRNRLFERVSPKKSWEGSVGGAVFSLIVAFTVSKFFTELSLTDWLVFSVVIVVAGTLGDLIESLFKRSIQVKDSGNILPGHGGILDRFDAVLISVPFLWAYLFLKFWFSTSAEAHFR